MYGSLLFYFLFVNISITLFIHNLLKRYSYHIDKEIFEDIPSKASDRIWLVFSQSRTPSAVRAVFGGLVSLISLIQCVILKQERMSSILHHEPQYYKYWEIKHDTGVTCIFTCILVLKNNSLQKEHY